MELGHLGIPMAAASSPQGLPSHKTQLSRIHYILIVAALTIFLAVMYNIIFAICCPRQSRQDQPGARSVLLIRGMSRSRGRNIPNWHSIPSITYKKEEIDIQDTNCSVCLAMFVDGEDVRQLPLCKHYFHSPCIDMWLYSHSDCPLCRANVLLHGSDQNQVSVGECPGDQIELLEERVNRRQDLSVTDTRSLV